MVSNGEFRPDMDVIDDFLSLARRQIAAAGNTPDKRWGIAEEDPATATANLFCVNRVLCS